MDFMAIDAGLTYAGDPDWLYDLPTEKRVRVMAYLLARKEQAGGFWSANGLQAVDLVHLLSKLVGSKKGKANDMDGLLSSLFDPEE